MSALTPAGAYGFSTVFPRGNIGFQEMPLMMSDSSQVVSRIGGAHGDQLWPSIKEPVHARADKLDGSLLTEFQTEEYKPLMSVTQTISSTHSLWTDAK